MGQVSIPSQPGQLGPGSFANPTAVVGLAAVNGIALTAMRSDAAPALSQAITPTWTGVHIFAGANTDFTSGPVRLTSDSQELQIGAGQDFRLSFDGTNSLIQNLGTALRVDSTSTEIIQTVAGSAVGFDIQNLSANNASYVQARFRNDAGRRLGIFVFSSTWAGGALVPNGPVGEQAFLDSDTIPLVLNANQIYVSGALHLINTTTAAAASAGGAALPATPQGFVVVDINGTSRKIPYYPT